MPLMRPGENVLDRLPAFPGASLAILHVCADENSSVAEIAKAVAMDEALATKLIAAANSAALGAVQPAKNLTAAAGRLGALAVRSLALATLLRTSPSSQFKQSALDRRSVWQHNLAVAAASAGAAAPARMSPDAHLVGLLHDLGKMVFAAELGAAYAEVLKEAAKSGVRLVEVEAEHLGMNHAEVGATAAETWGLPQEVVAAIGGHHCLAQATDILTFSVMVGNRVAACQGMLGTPQFGVPYDEPAEDAEPKVSGAILAQAQASLDRELPRIEAILSAVAG